MKLDAEYIRENVKNKLYFVGKIRHNVPLNFAHLAEGCKQFNNEDITPEQFKEKLKERLSSTDIKQVKEDVLPFVRNPKELDIWSNDYFVQLMDMVRIE